ncbi:hypothetical protein ACIP98_42465 [Streptomyces sp. NPDC088354]|uniref:hypothetical protein n=1 Tax=Streptomyces sp. NPDC088354 TaxID=3365856 RepID=UPI003800DE76
MADEYYAQPENLARGVEYIDHIARLAHELRRRFDEDIRETAGWTGEGDDFAKQFKPIEERDRELVVKTGGALFEALIGVTDGTTASLRNIRGTQNDVMDSIQEAKRRGGKR